MSSSKRLLIFAIGLLVVVLVGIGYSRWKPPVFKPTPPVFTVGAPIVAAPAQAPDSPSKTAAGVELYGCAGHGRTVVIKNTKSFTVGIRRVIQNRSYTSEMTESIDLVAPGAELNVVNILGSTAFFITDERGMDIGFFTARCPD